ncbi:FecR family protein [Chitinophaga skermanii]|uniref:FecR family protein n=1 Tax=Chitinophaga skermanii TaxID=331697 RepID=A0A327R3P1_9BACT|nr:FecR domain-containing protein [Chitinophaga skermanii]RAJ08497.1 FecR family protein [Chitinophaga skermanii]
MTNDQLSPEDKHWEAIIEKLQQQGVLPVDDELLQDSLRIKQAMQQMAAVEEEDIDVVWNDFKKNHIQATAVVPIRKKRMVWYAAAAMVGGLIVGAWAYNLLHSPVGKFVYDSPKAALKDTSIQLITGNGEVVRLDTVSKLKEADGTDLSAGHEALVYGQSAQSNVVVYNTLIIPKGKMYHLVLSDGTKVWLNAASSLRYPVNFHGAQRTVEVLGEAYFDVAKDVEHPFVVKAADKVTITVLGTGFNINTYKNRVQTTLVEGKVMVKCASDSVYLRPESQVTVAHDGAMLVRNVSSDLYTAWMNNELKFEDMPLGEIMEGLGRRYNYEIEFKDAAVAEKRCGANLLATEDISTILSFLEQVTDTRFTINQSKRIIMVERK